MSVISVPHSKWMLVTASTGNFTFQVRSGEAILQVSDGMPGDGDGFLYAQGEGERDTTMSGLKLGSGSSLWAFGRSVHPSCEIALVEHA